MASGAAFFDPASTGLLPEIVAADDLPAANSLLQLSSNGALVVGPALAGIVIACTGAALAVAFDAASFLVSAISLWFLTLPDARIALASESFLEELKAGFVEFRRHQWVPVTACYLVVLAFAFNGPIFALGPAAALSRLGGPSAWSLMLSAFGVGLIAGSLLAPKLLRTQRALGWSYLGNLSVVPMLFLLGTSHSEWLVVGSSALAGIAVGVFGVTYPTLLQQTIPKEKLSRVVSYFWLARVAAAPLAFAVVGPLSARFGTPNVFTVAGLAICVATLVSACLPGVWSVRARRQRVRR